MSKHRGILSGSSIVLGITGSIAAYKGLYILRELVKAGASVTPVLTNNATKFIAPLSFSALAGKEAVICAFPDKGSQAIRHVELASSSDLLLIAPATANIIGKAACGIADDFLSTLYLAVDCPVVMAPAMNHRMYASPRVKENVSRLKKDGVRFIGPDSGDLACGEGPGRMTSPAEIFKVSVNILSRNRQLAGKKVLITAGPTREYIDSIRFISNGSSGRMGYSLAEQARDMGAEVTLVSGPTAMGSPQGIRNIRVVSSSDMYREVMSAFPEVDVAIMTAAVGDFSPKEVFGGKIKKDKSSSLYLELFKTKDILEELGKIRDKQLLIGFSLESEDLLDNAKEKMERKKCSIMVANLHYDKGAGIGSEMGKVTVLTQGGEKIALAAQSKQELAKDLWDIFIEQGKLGSVDIQA